MSKTITIEIPEWTDEEKLRKAILDAVSRALSPEEISIEELRKILKIKSEELKEELEIDVNIEKLREKEKKRLL